MLIDYLKLAGLRRSEVRLPVSGPGPGPDRHQDDRTRHQGRDVGAAAELPPRAQLDAHAGADL